MSWNKRLVRCTSGDLVLYSIHEVYYDVRVGKGWEDSAPYSITELPVSVIEKSKGDIMTTLRNMERALTMPTLNYEDFYDV
jgi:hypothetical protein